MGPARRVIDRPTATVWLVWALATAWVAVFVARHGYNLPACDEWAFVRVSYAPWGERLDWLGARHCEHRFPLARVIYLISLDVTGHDFRAGMFLSVGFLAGTAAVLILTARHLRGRTSLADAAFPFVFLHPGHTENLLMGYQIAFTLSVVALALFAALVARSSRLDPARTALCGAVLLVPIALGGWLGLVFVPPLALWVGWQWWRARGMGLPAAAILAAAIGYLVWSVYLLLAGGGAQHANGVPDLASRIKAVAGVAGIGLGPGVGRYAKVAAIGTILLAIQSTVMFRLARAGYQQPEERPVAWGLLALQMGAWAFAVGVGYGRGAGLATRYAAFSAVGIAVTLLAAARYARSSTWLTAVVVLTGIVVVHSNLRHGRYEGERFDQWYGSIVKDLEAGVPIDLLAQRHKDFWVGSEDGWLALWENDFPLLRGVPPARPRSGLRVAFQRDGEQVDQRTVFARYHVDPGSERPVVAIRVRFRVGIWVPWERMIFTWIDPASGERRRSEVRPWVRPIKQSTVFWIDGPLSAGELLIGRPDCPIEVLGVEVVR
jgi:hypothetical protein